MAQTTSIPEFDRPPVSEVALSIEFSPLEKWRASDALSYGKLLQSDYPLMEIRRALPSQIEKFGEETWQQLSFRVEIGNPDATRFWFLADPSNWLIQIQQDRFIINWRKVTGTEIYPRYLSSLRPRFEQEWQRYRNFVVERGAGVIDVKQVEVTYVNDVLRGEGWQTFPEALALFTVLSAGSANQFLPPLETLTMAGSYLLPEERGRLRFSANHALRQFDNKEMIQMRLSVRGRPLSSLDADLLKWMDMGREWVVRGFTDLTSSKAHAIWGRTR
ncbi:MAG: TIGR04255 family protein [Actinomycetota bacterium]